MEHKKGLIKQDTIDLLDLARKLLHYWWILLLALIIGGVVAGGYSILRITPMYQAECMLYVNNGSISVGSTTVSMADLNASQSLVETYMVILESRQVLMEVADEAGVDYSYARMKSMVSASKVSDTEVFRVYVTSSDPEEAERIANVITEVLPDKIADIIEGSSVKIVDYAVVPSEKISPNNVKNAMMGAIALFAVAGMLLTLLILMDNTIQTEQDLFALTRYPILTKVPDRNVGSSKKHGKPNRYVQAEDELGTYDQTDSSDGSNWRFYSKEAYSLLRTNVMHSMASGERGKIIGITSSVANEYKTTTAIHLAARLSKDGNKNVLLMDCDIRMSDIAHRLCISNQTGLTDYLTGDLELESIIQHKEGYPNLSVIVGGSSTMNPAELLCSDKMKECFKKLAERFEYIIVDFPPATIVSDALELGVSCDGMIVVVRQNFTEKHSFEEALAKLKFLSINVLGIVFAGVADPGTRVRKYFKKYYGYYKKSYLKDENEQ